MTIRRLEDLAAELENAPVADGGDQGPPPRDPSNEPPRDRGRGFGGRPRGEIWEDCPVKALGVYGDVSFYLDVRGQLRGVDNHTVQKMLHIFGGRNHLLGSHFPTFDKDGDPQPGKFNQLQLSSAMIQACEEQGVWSPVGRVRGAGCWTDDDGDLIVHAGDQVLIGGAWKPPGVYGGKVYPASDPVPRPAATAKRANAGEDMLQLVETWNWRRPDIDPVLVVGLVCAQMLGGALEWRPVAWLTGDAATGKSTFQRMLLHLHGGEAGLLQAADATEAGIRSVVGYSSLPVAIDELEPDADRPQKVRAVIELARRAASGAQIFRGSTDQKGYQSNAYSCFLFSSILVPDMPPQDRSRLILLDLDRLASTAAKVSLDPRKLRAIGAELRRRLIDGWDELPERLELWRAALAEQGQTGRGADNYGTVIALADMVLSDGMPSQDRLSSWAAKLGHSITEEATEVGSNAEDMLTHLMSQPLDVWRRGKRYTVGQWLSFAGKLQGAPDEIEGVAASYANDNLAPWGLKVFGTGDDAEVFLANKKLAYLCQLFEGSPWADGVWSQAARRLPGTEAQALTLKGGIRTRGYRIPFRSIPGILDLQERAPKSSRPPDLPEGMEDYI